MLQICLNFANRKQTAIKNIKKKKTVRFGYGLIFVLLFCKQIKQTWVCSVCGNRQDGSQRQCAAQR